MPAWRALWEECAVEGRRVRWLVPGSSPRREEECCFWRARIRKRVLGVGSVGLGTEAGCVRSVLMGIIGCGASASSATPGSAGW